LKTLLVILLFLVSVLHGFSQKADTLAVKSKIDTLKQNNKAKDSSELAKITKSFKNYLPKVLGTTPYLPKEKPKIVFLRSLVFPGWGQISNKQYYKLPVVYGAAGVGIYFIYVNNSKCKEYVGYLKSLGSKTELLIDGRGPYSKTLINNAAKQYRRWKQGTVIGFAAGWLLFAIDANVAAHLKSFDITDDITGVFSPKVMNTFGQNTLGLSLNLKLD
jgi:hypothetical protein